MMATPTNYETSTWNGYDIKFYPKSHTYHIRAGATDRPWSKVPSVTTVLNAVDGGKSGAMAYWAANLAADSVTQQLHPYSDRTLPAGVIMGIAENARKAHTVKRDKAGDAGNVAHEWLEKYCYYLRDGTPKPRRPSDKSAQWIVDRALQFFDNHEVKPIHIERKLGGMLDDQGYAGTVDLIALVDGELWMIDFKTSNHPSWTHVTQMAGYELILGDRLTCVKHCVLYIDLKSTARVAKGVTPPYWPLVYTPSADIMDSWRHALGMYLAIKGMKEVLK